MNNFTPKQFILKMLLKNGYDISVHKCATKPYNGPKLAFVHIAKCGGISIDTALRNAFAKPEQRRIDRDSTLASSLSSFDSKINSIDSACDFSEHHTKVLQKMFEYYLSLNWQYISGHIATNEDILSRYKDNYAFVTILRDPVERFISNYIFNKLTNKMPFMPPSSISNDDLITEAKLILDSRRGWHLANIPTMCVTGKFPNNAEQAKALRQRFSENLSQYKVVGFLSNLDKFASDIEQLTDRKITIPHKNSVNDINSSEQQQIKSTLADFFNEKETLKKIQKLCQYEIDNYQAAMNKYS